MISKPWNVSLRVVQGMRPFTYGHDSKEQDVQIENFEQLSCSAGKPALVHNDNPKKVARLLGAPGKKVLADIVALVRQLADREQWPLDVVRIRPVNDPEVTGWEYVRLILSFASTFEESDHAMHQLYPELDAQFERWTAEEQEVYWRLLSLDFEATATSRIAS